MCKQNFNKWVNTISNGQDLSDDIIDILADKDNVFSVEMGYIDEENVANGYFKNDHALYAQIKEINDKEINDTKFGTVYVLYTDDSDYEDYIIYYNLDEAVSDLNELENSLENSIESQLDDFKKNLGGYEDRVYAEVKKEFNNSGHFYSFNIYLDGDLFVDGIFSLDAEKVIEDIQIYEQLESELKNNYGIRINSIKKINHGFERAFEFEFSKGDNSITYEVEIYGSTQGKTKKLNSYIDDLDIDDILDQLE